MSVPPPAEGRLSDLPAVIVITGAMAAGKSSVAEALSRRLPVAAHVRGDMFRRFIVSGQAPMDPPLSEQARAQLELRHSLAAQAADGYAAAGITAVVQDLLLENDLVRFTRRVRTRPCYAFILTPDADTLAARDDARHKHTYREWTAGELDAAARSTTGGLHVDSTGWTVEETVSYLLDHLDEARTP
ncbi:AAA family ATPase [Ruania zhangjianzhongii]|uniref:AAA family ATPase n=1 Tax=Ruania zhangjianzhongii TaxID=2603206 RepID=UPI0011C72D07|nr:AAA family ATPase [Ruania zhangjianzhongii]